MADLSEELKLILSARYGEEVRGALHDSLVAMNDENKEAYADVSDVVNKATSATTLANTATTNANAAADAANEAAEKAEDAASAVIVERDWSLLFNDDGSVTFLYDDGEE